MGGMWQASPVGGFAAMKLTAWYSGFRVFLGLGSRVLGFQGCRGLGVQGLGFRV